MNKGLKFEALMVDLVGEAVRDVLPDGLLLGVINERDVLVSITGSSGAGGAVGYVERHAYSLTIVAGGATVQVAGTFSKLKQQHTVPYRGFARCYERNGRVGVWGPNDS